MSVWEMNEILIYIHCNYINSTMLQGRQKTKNKKKKTHSSVDMLTSSFVGGGLGRDSN